MFRIKFLTGTGARASELKNAVMGDEAWRGRMGAGAETACAGVVPMQAGGGG